MNLLLYYESKRALECAGQTIQSGNAPATWFGQELPTLPDSLFEELGYPGALADSPAEQSAWADRDDDNEAIAGLLRLFALPALSF
jgi:hypothetical protein